MTASPTSTSLPAQAQDKFSFTAISADGTRISCLLERKATLTKHSGTCVLLAHGLGQDKSSPAVRGIAEGLPYNVCTYDARGLGDSSGEASICDFKDAVEDMNAVVDKLAGLGLPVHTVFGLSKGGEVAILFVNQYPSKIRQLAVLGVHYDLSRNDECQLTPAQLRQIQTQGYIVWKRYGRNNNPRFWIIRKEDLRLRAAMDVHTPMSRISSHVGILVLHGEDDEVVPASEARKYAEMMAGRSNFSWTVLEGVTHACSTPEEIQKVVETVERFTEGEPLDSGAVAAGEGYYGAPPTADAGKLPRRGSSASQAAPPQPGLSPAILAEFLETPSELAADRWALDSLTPPYVPPSGASRSRGNSSSTPVAPLDLYVEELDGADDSGRRGSVSALSAALSSAGLGPNRVAKVPTPPMPIAVKIDGRGGKGQPAVAEEEEDVAFRLSP